MLELTGVVTGISRDGANNRVATITLDLQAGQVAKSSVDVLSVDFTLDQHVIISVDVV